MERRPYNPNLRENELQPLRKLFEIDSADMTSQGYYQNERFSALRKFAVAYIEEISKCEPFDAFVPFLAMSYFDRFVSSHNLPKVIASNDEENVKLFVICCLTLAWKMRIKTFKVDTFLEERKFQFDSNHVRIMELYILDALEWKMRSLTAICFSGYFIKLLRLPSMKQLVQPVYQIIIRAQADISFTRFRPPIIAAAAALTASSKMFPKQVDKFRGIISCCQFVRAEELFRCMEAMETTKFKADDAWSVPIGEPTNDSEANKPEPVGMSSPSQRPAKPRSEPIPISGSQAAKPPQPVQASNAALLRASIPPGAVANEVVGAKSPLKVEMEEILQMKIDDPNMNFELRWTDPQEPKVTAASILWALSDGSGLISPIGSTTSVGPGGFSLGNCCPIMKWWTEGAHDQ